MVVNNLLNKIFIKFHIFTDLVIFEELVHCSEIVVQLFKPF